MKRLFDMDIKQIVLAIVALFLILVAVIFFLAALTTNKAGERDPLQSVADFIIREEETVKEVIKEEVIIEEEIILPSFVLLDIPFTPQAPFGNWEDPRQDYGCEESSILMVMRWVNDEPLTLAEAEKEIIAISEFEKENYGEFHDASVQDTLKVLKAYFSYNNVSLGFNVTVEDIKTELARGNAVIMPLDGRIVGNPYYTPPGPIQHQLVIRGYDDATEEFITNDPGTRRGEEYRYNYQVLVNAIGNYATGRDEPIIERQNVVLVISRQ